MTAPTPSASPSTDPGRWGGWAAGLYGWVWSPLERDRIGGWGRAWRLLAGWVLPAGLLGAAPAAAAAALLGGLAAVLSDAYWIRRARRAGWATVAFFPTTPAVRRAVLRQAGLDPTARRWRDGPAWERHTQVRRWARPGEAPADAAARFRAARAAEWRRIAELADPGGGLVLLSVTYSTLGGVDPPAVGGGLGAGAPFPETVRRQRRGFPRVQRRCFGGPVPRRAEPPDRAAAWRAVALPLRGRGW